jgi:hypothetical protein
MNDSPISVKQDPKRSQEPNIDIELYSEGLFDGLCNLKPTKPHIYDYWQGYQLGLREYLCKQLGVEITELPA